MGYPCRNTENINERSFSNWRRCALGRGYRIARPGGWRRQYGGTVVQKRSTANGVASARYWSAPSLPFYGIICQRALMDCSLKTSSWSQGHGMAWHLLFFFKAGKYAWKEGAHNKLKTFMELNYNFLYNCNFTKKNLNNYLSVYSVNVEKIPES